jgi:DNA-directed RNA polymerase specialized sigma24 family protein
VLGGDGLTFPQLRGWRASVDGSVEMADFRALYDHFYPLVWRWVARVGVPGDAREDVVQEVFLTIYGKLDTFEARSSMKTWVLAITVRVTQGYRRRGARLPAAGLERAR